VLLESVVFSVEEVDLVLKVLHRRFILLILVLQVDLLQVLSGSIQIMKPQNLLVSHLDLVCQILGELLLFADLLLELIDDLRELLTTLVGLS